MGSVHRMGNARSIIMIHNAPEPELGTIIGSVGGFMSSIGCFTGLAELDVAMYYFQKGKPAKMSLDSLLQPIDERLTNHFNKDGLLSLYYEKWYAYKPKNGRSIKLPVLWNDNPTLINRLMRFLRSCYYQDYQGDQALAAVLFLASVGMIKRRDCDDHQEYLKCFDPSFEPFVSESPNPIVVDLRNALMHNAVTFIKTGIRFENRRDKGGRCRFNHEFGYEEIVRIARNVMDRIESPGLDLTGFPEGSKEHLVAMASEMDPVISGKSTFSGTMRLMAVKVAIITLCDESWPRVKELFSYLIKSVDERKELETETINRFLDSRDPGEVRRNLAHEFENGSMTDPSQDGFFDLDPYLMSLYLVTRTPFVIAQADSIRDAVGIADRVKAANPNFTWPTEECILW